MMKKGLIFMVMALALGACKYHRIGDLNMISNRNIDTKGDYILLRHNVEGKAKQKHDDVLERAVDAATSQVPGGEYLMNVRIEVKGNGEKLRLTGDVWGRDTLRVER